jgi:hypothetical protein
VRRQNDHSNNISEQRKDIAELERCRGKWIAALADDYYPPVSNRMMAQVFRFPGQRLGKKFVGETQVETPRTSGRKLRSHSVSPESKARAQEYKSTRNKEKPEETEDGSGVEPCHDLGSDSPFLFKSYNWLFPGYSPQHTIEG